MGTLDSENLKWHIILNLQLNCLQSFKRFIMMSQSRSLLTLTDGSASVWLAEDCFSLRINQSNFIFNCTVQIELNWLTKNVNVFVFSSKRRQFWEKNEDIKLQKICFTKLTAFDLDTFASKFLIFRFGYSLTADRQLCTINILSVSVYGLTFIIIQSYPLIMRSEMWCDFLFTVAALLLGVVLSCHPAHALQPLLLSSVPAPTTC